MNSSAPTRTNAERADHTRARILDAATREFSGNGLAGARTERIAAAAGVNKALLYYYFRSKEALYAETLNTVALRMAETSLSVLSSGATAGERFLRAALHHFDRIYSQPVFQTLMQQEMIRLREDESRMRSPLVEKLFQPMAEKMLAVAAEGIQSGELVAVESTQLIFAAIGSNVFYFLSGPMMHFLAGQDPFHPLALAFRRKAAIEYLGQAIFTDRANGALIAQRVLADTPMPAHVGLPPNPFRKPEQRARKGYRSSKK